MDVGVLGTGAVGRTIAGKLTELGHEVMVGTRDVAALMEREAGPRGGEPFARWAEAHPGVTVGTFAEAAGHGEVVFNCTAGRGSLDALGAAGEDALAGKVLVDVANPLDYSEGVLFLFVSNTDSLAERIQRSFPRSHVVKTLNTVNARLMADPGAVGNGDHTMFVAGDDAGAKEGATEILRAFGWTRVLDLGDLTAARGMEMYLPLWVRMMGALEEGPAFNIKVVT